jgi:hypothetical protein
MNWQIAEALAMKGWLETRWRLIPLIVWPAFVVAMNYQGRYNPPAARNVFFWMWIVLSCLTVMLAGSGVKSQAPTHISFPEGLAGSTQFTISLPVSRAWLIVLRAGIGLLELYAATLITAFTVWHLFPSVSSTVTLADFARLVVILILWLPIPYCVAVLSQAFVVEPLSFLPAGYGLVLLLWLLHEISPAVDVVRVFGAESPLVTHRLPVSQLATGVLLAVSLLLVTVWAVRRREY